MTQSLGSKLARGAALMLLLRWFSRGTGLISAMVLARLLTPEDFGLVAVAIAVTQLFELVLETSTETSLISRKSHDPDEWNTAWALRVLSGALISTGMVVGGFVAIQVYGDSRYGAIFWVMALASLIRGFENIGVVEFRLNMEFERDALFLMICKVASVVATLIFAWLFQSYISILVAMFAAALFRVAYSYRVHVFRPNFSLSKWRVFLGFSAWMLCLNLSRYLMTSADKLILGRIVSARVLGFYKMSSELASLPVSEVVFPIARTLNVGFASVREDREKFGRLLLAAFGMVSLFAFPFTFGMMVAAEELVAVILGSQWGSVAPYLKVFAVYYLFYSLLHYFGTAMIVMGEVRRYALIFGVLAISALAVALWLSGRYDPLMAFSRSNAVGMGLLTLAMWQLQIRRGLMTWHSLVSVIWRPALAGLAMAGLIASIDWPIEAVLLRLFAKVALGSVVFLTILLGLWGVAGRPESAESTLFDAVSRRFRRTS